MGGPRQQAYRTMESTRLSLIGTTVDLYFQLGYLNDRIALARQSIDYADKTLKLVNVQLDAGAVSPLNRAESAQNLASQKAGLHDLIEQKVEARGRAQPAAQWRDLSVARR